MRGSVIAATLGVATMLMTACSDRASDAVDDVTFTASDGSSASVADFSGLPLVVNMWATNCVPCVKEMPAFDQVANEIADTIQIIGVNVFDTPEDAAAFAADLGVGYPQFTDPDGALSSALLVTGLPATGFFDARGNLLEVHQGAFTADELRAAIAEYFPIEPTGATT
ncbi:MAG: TlpA family protein disulfide reductase [Actinomycetia bacterium]|nr:TlpA family protein disulfide reductase [Actinomycetes bacterium]